MTQHPYDQLSKQLLEELLAPLGTVQRSLEIPGEAKWVDLWFMPHAHQAARQSRDLLSRIAQHPCLLEPYRNPPTRFEVCSCVLKLLWVQEELRRKADQQKQAISAQDLPFLWIIATSISKPILQEFGAKPNQDWEKGVYFTAQGFRTVLVSINQLPKTRDTLILRLLDRGQNQRDAIAELLALSAHDPQRYQMLRILGNWKVALELEQIEVEERETMMAFSQAFLEWEKVTEQKGIQEGIQKGIQQGIEQGIEHERSLILRLLTRKLGVISPELTVLVQSLSLVDLESLGEALLDFNQIQDLQAWLNPSSD